MNYATEDAVIITLAIPCFCLRRVGLCAKWKKKKMLRRDAASRDTSWSIVRPDTSEMQERGFVLDCCLRLIVTSKSRVGGILINRKLIVRVLERRTRIKTAGKKRMDVGASATTKKQGEANMENLSLEGCIVVALRWLWLASVSLSLFITSLWRESSKYKVLH